MIFIENMITIATLIANHRERVTERHIIKIYNKSNNVLKNLKTIRQHSRKHFNLKIKALKIIFMH